MFKLKTIPMLIAGTMIGAGAVVAQTVQESTALEATLAPFVAESLPPVTAPQALPAEAPAPLTAEAVTPVDPAAAPLAVDATAPAPLATDTVNPAAPIVTSGSPSATTAASNDRFMSVTGSTDKHGKRASRMHTQRHGSHAAYGSAHKGFPMNVSETAGLGANTGQERQFAVATAVDQAYTPVRVASSADETAGPSIDALQTAQQPASDRPFRFASLFRKNSTR